MPLGIPVVPDDQKIIATSSSFIVPFCNDGGCLESPEDFMKSGRELMILQMI